MRPDLEEMLADPRHPGWDGKAGEPLPSWVTSFRPHQIDAVRRIAEAFDHTDTVILDAPVGSGKSLIADMSRRVLDQRAVYTCTTKSLQDQLARDFDYMRVLKGRANYPTQYGPWPEVNAGDCTMSPAEPGCMWCESSSFCGYQNAKREALISSTAILNTSYFLTEANGPGRFGKENARGLVILDEADELEKALMGFVEVEVGQWWRKQLRIGMPQVKTENAKSNDWQEWTEEALAAATSYLSRLNPHATDVKARRHYQRTSNLVGKLNMLREELPGGGWVYDGYGRREPTVLFRPIKVDRLGPTYLWRHGRKFLLMSGSVISSGEMADSLGIANHEAVNVRVEWDPAKRPIFVTPVADVTYRNKDAAYPKLAKAVWQVMQRHPDERILVHSVSYALTKFLVDEIAPGTDRPIFTYDNAGDRDQALADYRATPGAVIFAPSLDRGIDLKDDDCRVMVICKVPYPSMGDKQVKMRANMGRAGRVWYGVQTVRTIVQMLGRGMRHEDDSVTTYILDKQFTSNVMRRSRSMIPGYVKDAMIFDRVIDP